MYRPLDDYMGWDEKWQCGVTELRSSISWLGNFKVHDEVDDGCPGSNSEVPKMPANLGVTR